MRLRSVLAMISFDGVEDYIDMGDDGGFQLAITNGYIRSWVNEPGRTDSSVLSGPYIALDEWFLLGSTWDGSTHRLYLDAVEVSSGSYSGNMGTSAKTSLIGAKHYGGGHVDKNDVVEVQ